MHQYVLSISLNYEPQYVTKATDGSMDHAKALKKYDLQIKEPN